MVAIRNLYRQKIRNLLTLLGVAMGISVFVSSVSVSNGFKTQIQDIVKSYSIDITVQEKGAATPVISKIPVSEYRALQGLTGVKKVSALIMGSIRAPWNPYFLVAGISSIEPLSSKISILEGRFFTPGNREVILGAVAAKQLGYTVGNKIFLTDNEMFSITGIFSIGSKIVDGAAILDIQDAQHLFKRDNFINMAFLQLDQGSRPEKVVEQINRSFPRLTAIRSEEMVGQIRLFETVELFVGVISAISLLTCCIVVMNTLFMAISERTKEIGILLAVGWSRLMIFRTILYEAMLLCFLGGILGNIIGLASLWFFGRSHVVGLGWIPSSIPPIIVIESIGLAVFLGIVSSFYPAIHASRLLPAVALRYE